MPSPVIQVTRRPLSNSIAINNSTSYDTGLKVLRQASYFNTVQKWQSYLPYEQKVCYGDNISIQIHSQRMGDYFKYPALFICDSNGDVIPGIDLSIAPFFKGVQTVDGNDYISPYNDGIDIPLVSSMWNFTLGSFPAQITADGIYYLRLENYEPTTLNTLVYYSEPMFLRSVWDNTMVFTFAYNGDNASKQIVQGGWFNDPGVNTDPYLPIFSMRAEGFINDFDPNALNIGYLQQGYEQLQIQTLQTTWWTLTIGENFMGIPYYMLQMITEALLADNLAIDNYWRVLYNPNGNSSLTKIWKKKDAQVIPLVYASTTIMDRFQEQQDFVVPYTTPLTRIFTSEFDTTFD